MPHLLPSASRPERANAPDSVSGNCPHCAAVGEIVWPGSGPDRFEIRRCAACRTAFTVPQLAEQDLAAYYEETYYGDRNVRFLSLLEHFVRGFRSRRAKKLGRLMSPGRVLDIGCGRGLTLAALRDAGWQVVGVERSLTAARYARESLGLDVSSEGFDPGRYPAASFDAVILWHVLEHLADPSAVLAGIARLLKPGGVLMVAVPNIDSWQARLSHYAWFHLDLPRHLWHFSAASLGDALQRAGLRVHETSHCSLEQNPYGWVQSVLNWCGLRHNLLYDLIRNRSARSIERPWRSYPIQSLCSLAALIVMLPIAFMLLIPEAVFRAGATVEMVAVRETAPESAT